MRTRWYTVFIDRSYHSPVIASTKALQRVFMPSFVMLYTENISLQDFANQVTCLEVIDTTNFFLCEILSNVADKGACGTHKHRHPYNTKPGMTLSNNCG